MSSKNKFQLLLDNPFLSLTWVKLSFVVMVFLITMIITNRSLLHPGFFRTHDFVHGARIAEMTRALQDGHFPVRWSKNFGYGYGMPLFEFYAPLPYYFGAVVYWLTQNLLFSVKLLWLLPNIITFIGTYLFARRHVGRLGGVIAAVLFVLAPYRAVNLYVRGAISEVWAMSFFPVILYGIDSYLIQKSKSDWSTMVWGWTGLFLSHNLMTLFFVPFGITYAVVRTIFTVEKKNWVKKFSGLLGYFLLSIGVASFYIFPAFLEKNYTQVDEKILSGYFHYSQHFLYIRQFVQENWKYGGSHWGPVDDMSYFLGYGQILLLALSLVLLARYLFRTITTTSATKKNHQFKTILKYSLFYFFLGSVLFLSVQKSQFIWDNISLLQVAQFPWRFLALSALFIAIIGSFSFNLIEKVSIRLLLSVCVLILLGVSSWKYFAPEFYLDDAESLYYSSEQRIQEEMSETLPDYISKSLTIEQRVPELRVEVVGLEEERRQRDVLVDRTHEILVRTNLSSERLLRFHVSDFPGWTASIDGNQVTHDTKAEGFIEVSVPPGEHLTGLQLNSTPVRRTADLVSLVSVLLLGYLLVSFKDTHNQNKSL